MSLHAHQEVKCPRCNSIKVDIIEVSHNFTIVFPFEDGEYLEGAKHMGEYSHDEGRCQDCKHHWKFRKDVSELKP